MTAMMITVWNVNEMLVLDVNIDGGRGFAGTIFCGRLTSLTSKALG